MGVEGGKVKQYNVTSGPRGGDFEAFVLGERSASMQLPMSKNAMRPQR